MNSPFFGALVIFILCALAFLSATQANKRKNKFYFRNNAALLFILPVAGLSLLMMAYFHSPNVKIVEWGGPEQFGQFGDMIGGILNPILGFMTIILLIRTLTEQRNANKLFKRAELISSNKSDIKDGLEFHNSKLKEQLKQTSLFCPGEASPRFAYKFVIEKKVQLLGTDPLSALQCNLIRIMTAKQVNDTSDILNFINSAESNHQKREYSRILTICTELRSIVKTIRRGYLDLLKLEETEFLIETAREKYIYLLLECESLKIISDAELKNYIEECEAIARNKIIELQT